MLLTEDEIKEINNKCPHEQGIFKEPYGIPTEIKEHVIYCRTEIGGVSGGSCWDSSNPQHYTCEPSKERMKILDIVLKKVWPDLSYLQYKEVESLINDSERTEWEYYGNNTEWRIEYIKLSDIEKLKASFK